MPSEDLHLAEQPMPGPQQSDGTETYKEPEQPSDTRNSITTDQRNDKEGPEHLTRRSTFEEQTRPPYADAVRSLSFSVIYDAPINAREPNWPSGWRPYLCLTSGFLLMMNSWGVVNAYGTFASYYTQHLLPGHDVAQLNLVGSTQCFVVLALSAVVGRFLDAGPKYSRILLVLGTVLLSLGTFLLSVVNKQGHYNQGNYGLIWLTQGFVSGLGMACFFVTASQVVATWFKRRKSLAIGIVASGASVAGLVYPLMISILITQVGFNNAVRCMAAVVTGTAIFAIIFARPNPAAEIRRPEKWSFGAFVDLHAFQNPAFAWLCAAISILFFGFYAVFFNLESWAASEGLGYRGEAPSSIGLVKEVHNDAIRTFYLLCIMNGTSLVGRISSAYFCDIFGALNVHAIVTFIGALLVLLLWTMTHTVPAAVCFVVFFGIFSGAVIGLPPASVAYILGPNGQAKLGQWTGMMYTCAAISALTGPVIAGHLITRFDQNFLTVQLWSGLCLFLSACCMTMAIYYRRRATARGAKAATDEEMKAEQFAFPSDANTEVDRSEAVSTKDEKDQSQP